MTAIILKITDLPKKIQILYPVITESEMLINKERLEKRRALCYN